jgi:hypothetical protein
MAGIKCVFPSPQSLSMDEKSFADFRFLLEAVGV